MNQDANYPIENLYWWCDFCACFHANNEYCPFLFYQEYPPGLDGTGGVEKVIETVEICPCCHQVVRKVE